MTQELGPWPPPWSVLNSGLKLLILIPLLCLLGCAGQIDPGNPITVTSSSEASGSWVIERRGFP